MTYHPPENDAPLSEWANFLMPATFGMSQIHAGFGMDRDSLTVKLRDSGCVKNVITKNEIDEGGWVEIGHRIREAVKRGKD